MSQRWSVCFQYSPRLPASVLIDPGLGLGLSLALMRFPRGNSRLGNSPLVTTNGVFPANPEVISALRRDRTLPLKRMFDRKIDA